MAKYSDIFAISGVILRNSFNHKLQMSNLKIPLDAESLLKICIILIYDKTRKLDKTLHENGDFFKKKFGSS